MPVNLDQHVAFAAPEITDGDIAAVTRVLRSGWLTTDTEVGRLEIELQDHIGAPHVIAVSSCTSALEIAIAHLGLPRGSRVGVPAWTFVSSALAAARHGLVPVLLDVEPDTLNLSADALAREAPGLDAAVVVHFGGAPVNPAVHEVAAAHGLPVVEDAAHALGATDARGQIGASGAATCFSFYATKNLTSGEGGALATDDEALATFARSYRLHGMDADAWARYTPGGRAHYDVVEPGIKGNMPDLLAALARSQLARFDATQRRRRQITDLYRSHLAGTAARPLDAHPGSADHLMVVRLPEGVDREDVIAALRARDIGTSVHFQPLHTLTWFRRNAVMPLGGLPVCDSLAERVLSLPLSVTMTDDDVDRVAGTLLDTLDP